MKMVALFFGNKAFREVHLEKFLGLQKFLADFAGTLKKKIF